MDTTNFEIRASGDRAEVLIYGDIGESDAPGSVAARDFVERLNAIAADTIAVRINSYGGSVADGLAIYNALRRHKARIEVSIDGVAVSIASLIAMAGDRVSMADGALMMIHAPWVPAAGNAAKLREQADILDQHAIAMRGAYARRIGDKAAKRLLADGADHWFTAAEALAARLIEEITDSHAVAASGAANRYPEVQKMTEQANPAPQQTNVVEIEAAAVQRANAALIARNEKLRVMRGLASDPAVAELITEIIADPSVTMEQAYERIGVKMGEGAEPLNAIPRSQTYGAAGPVAVYGRNAHHGEFIAAASDMLLLRDGIPVAKPHAAANDLRGMSILQLAQTLVGQRGATWRGNSPHAVIQAAMTTSDLPILLSNTANKALQVGFANEIGTHTVWTREVVVANFKDQTRVAVSEAPELEEIPEHGAYRNGYLTERAESYRIATYGRVLNVSRHAMVNDDLAGITRAAMAFGGSAQRKIADLAYLPITSNPTMSDGTTLFHADHGNLEASGSALSVTSLGSLRAKMRLQTGQNGGLLNVTPRYLLVPAALETTAEQLLASLVDPSKSNSTQNPEWIRGLTLVVDPRFDANSTTAWYLAASPMQVDTVEVAFLDAERIHVEERSEWETDNFEIKCRVDAGAAVLDWAGLAKNPGA